MVAVARFKLNGKIYTSAAMQEVSLKDLLLFETQSLEMGLPLKWADLMNTAQELAELTEAEQRRHPQALVLTAVTIWASRRTAGEDLTFEQAVDFPMTQLEFLPSDEAPADPTPARPRARKASGRAGGRPAAKGASTRRTTSAARSGND